MSGSHIRVVIADDHDLVRSGLAVLLEAFPDLSLVGAASNGQEVIQLCDKVEADVILMDLNMPGMGGVLATRTVRRHHPHIQIVALVGFEENGLLKEVMAAGAAAYVHKHAPIDDMAGAIRAAAARGAGPDPDPVGNSACRGHLQG
jgi:two-component system invasion response regulator UvrY